MMQSLLNGKKSGYEETDPNVRDDFVGLVETMRTTNSTARPPDPPAPEEIGDVAIRRDQPARNAAGRSRSRIPNFYLSFI
jgi:hypothetical protein